VSDYAALKDTIWEDKGTSGMTIYGVPVIAAFGFGVEPISGDMSEEVLEESLFGSCGSMAKFWVTSMHEAKQNNPDIWEVLTVLGEDTLKNLIPGWGTQFHVRCKMGSCDDITMMTSSVSPEGYEAVKAFMARVSSCVALTSVSAPIALVSSLSLAEIQIQSKMKHSINKFKGIMMCVDNNFKAGTMSNFHLPELSPK